MNTESINISAPTFKLSNGDEVTVTATRTDQMHIKVTVGENAILDTAIYMGGEIAHHHVTSTMAEIVSLYNNIDKWDGTSAKYYHLNFPYCFMSFAYNDEIEMHHGPLREARRTYTPDNRYQAARVEIWSGNILFAGPMYLNISRDDLLRLLRNMLYCVKNAAPTEFTA
jgi:hypothetical protein